MYGFMLYIAQPQMQEKSRNLIHFGEVTELAESTGLENRRRFIPTVGSNPTLSAKSKGYP